MNHKAGDKVNIYHDPVTRKSIEGKAELVEFRFSQTDIDEDCDMEMWEVRFDGEIEPYFRLIKTEK